MMCFHLKGYGKSNRISNEKKNFKGKHEAQSKKLWKALTGSFLLKTINVRSFIPPMTGSS